MRFLRGLWHFLVGVKDALVLLFLVLFFAGVWGALSLRGGGGTGGGVPDGGALLLDLNGRLVEQASDRSPFFRSGDDNGEVRTRDVLRAVNRAREDGRIRALVLNLDSFLGGGQASLQAIGRALDAFKASGKPVYAYSTAYIDDGYLLASHASETWLDPLGGVLLTGPGGANLYFADALKKLAVNVEVFRVGTYKSAVEPFTRADASPEAKAAEQALVDSLWRTYAGEVAASRKVDVNAFLAGLPAALKARGGDGAGVALAARMVDKIGTEAAFGKRVADKVGDGDDHEEAPYKAVRLDRYLKATDPVRGGGDAVGVVYIVGDIVDGDAPAGRAGGDTIAKSIRHALANDAIKALVLRIDSPGGSVLASEKIRQAVLDAKTKGLPVVASFGPVAASGGYWVSTAADEVFAEASTITGSIGVFAIIPTFNQTLKRYGIGADGVRSTPYSGEPDVLRGLTPDTRVIIQSGVEDVYHRFTTLVGAARKLPVAEVDRIGQGRVWAGREAQQLKLVDTLGGLDEAVAAARTRAKLPKDARTVDVEAEPSLVLRLLRRLQGGGVDETTVRDPYAKLARAGQARAAAAVVTALSVGRGATMQAACLECAGYAPAAAPARPAGALIAEWLAR